MRRWCATAHSMRWNPDRHPTYPIGVQEIRLAAEKKYENELKALQAADKAARPPGWALSPKAVEVYILGSDKPVGGVTITPKYIGDRALVQVAIATLASDRTLMLVGEPGTAKSWLSE